MAIIVENKESKRKFVLISANFEYSKKLGFDLLINNKIFSFDVEIYAKYRATSTANQKLSVIPSSDNTTAKII
jgi:hypothetical protein